MSRDRARTSPPEGVFDLRRLALPGEDHTDCFSCARIPANQQAAFDFHHCGSSGGTGAFDPAPRFQVVLGLEGMLSLTPEIQLRAGDVAVIAPDTAASWQTEGPTRWLVNSYADNSATAPQGIIRIDMDAPRSPSPAPPAELLKGPVPACTRAEGVASADGLWSCGTWQAEPYHRIPQRYSYSELMLLLEGQVSIFDEAGNCAEFGPGDLFLLTEGATLGWESTSVVRKFWSIFRPAQS